MTDPTSRPPDATTGNDWPKEATDKVVSIVDTVRDKTTGPALKIARGIVFGLAAAFMAVTLLVLTLVLVVRLLDNYLPDAVFGEEHTWAAHLILGALLTAGGLYLWSKRTTRTSD